MSHENYEEMIDKFEHALHKITTETTRGVIFEHLPPIDLWNKTKSYVTQLRELACMHVSGKATFSFQIS